MQKDLEIVVNNVKCNLFKLKHTEYLKDLYDVEICNERLSFYSLDSLKLELLFLQNLKYLKYSKKQYIQILSGNYKELFTKENKITKLLSIDLNEYTEINNYNTVINNNNVNTGNDKWSEFDI